MDLAGFERIGAGIAQVVNQLRLDHMAALWIKLDGSLQGSIHPDRQIRSLVSCGGIAHPGHPFRLDLPPQTLAMEQSDRTGMNFPPDEVTIKDHVRF